MSTFALILCFASGSCAPPTITPNLETCDSLAVAYQDIGSRNRNYTYTKCVEYPARVPLDIQWLGSWREDDYEIDDQGKIIKQPAPKSAEEMASIRARAWATRRGKYGERGHR